MKKLFIVVAVLMALAFIAGPSNALIGIEDPVVGNSFRVPFLVAMGTTGLDTLVIYQEITDLAAYGTVAAPAGVMAWVLWSPLSRHCGDGNSSYSGGDVVAISVRDRILNDVASTEWPNLEIDLDGDGTNDHYFGYLTYTNNFPATANNIQAYVQLVDLANGQAAGTLATHYEIATTGAGNLNYNVDQVSVSNAAGVAASFNFNGTAYAFPGAWEVMSPNAYVRSYYAERGIARVAPTSIRFTPRYYLHDADGQSYIMIYKSVNHNAAGQGNTIAVNWWGTTENRLSGNINVPGEMTMINLRTSLPASLVASYPAAGWVDIGNPDVLGATLRDTAGVANWADIEWLCWVWNVASSTTAGLNWSALWVDKEVGTQ